jgi:hypothetical protein
MQVPRWAHFRGSVCLIRKIRLSFITTQYGPDGLLGGSVCWTLQEAKQRAHDFAGQQIGPWRPAPLLAGNARKFCRAKAKCLRS